MCAVRLAWVYRSGIGPRLIFGFRLFKYIYFFFVVIRQCLTEDYTGYGWVVFRFLAGLSVFSFFFFLHPSWLLPAVAMAKGEVFGGVGVVFQGLDPLIFHSVESIF